MNQVINTDNSHPAHFLTPLLPPTGTILLHSTGHIKNSVDHVRNLSFHNGIVVNNLMPLGRG